MLTVYKQDLKEELVLRQGELKNLLAEREALIAQGGYNPFRRKIAMDVRENLIQCYKEINKIQKNIRNKSF